MSHVVPFFSIIIPTYNRAEFLTESVQSILDQVYTDFELIIVDDGSTDNTSEVIRMIGDKRVRYFFKENQERGIARNFGLSKALGVYVSFHDSDDIIYRHHLQTAFDSVHRLNNPEVFHLDYEFRDEEKNILPRKPKLHSLLNNHLLENSEVSVLGVFLKREVAMAHQFLAHRSAIVAEDLYVWLTLASRYKFYHVPVVTSALVLHKGRSLNERNPFKFLKSTLLIIGKLSQDDVFIRFYSSRRVNFFFAKSLQQVALLYAINGDLKWTYLLMKRGINYSWHIIYTKTFLATLRIALVNLIK